MKNLYRVNFDRKKCFYAHYVIDIEAANRDEAKEIAKKMWAEHFNERDVPNMFHLNVRKLKDAEEFLYHYFRRIECGKDF